MKLFKPIIVFCIVLFSSTNADAKISANALLRKVSNNLRKANDYSVQANIIIDMPFIRMLPINAKIYFKQKNNFKVESKGIAIVPKQGFAETSKLLNDTGSYTAILQGEEKIDTIRTIIVNMLPLSDSSDLILAKLWIYQEKGVILKSQFTTKSNGTIATEYTYGNNIEYGLPDQMIFSVDIKKFKMPKNVMTGVNKSNSDKNDKNNTNKKGKITIKLSNYQVNKGIPDGIFSKN